jgi:hypothetical protein
MELISSELQTKAWRKLQKWYKGGKHTECEVYQKSQLLHIINKILIDLGKEKITCIPYTSDRINEDKELYTIENCHCPGKNKLKNKFEYTENFDGKLELFGKIFYFNLKFVCEDGGSQNRTLKLVYMFIKSQYKHIQKHNPKNTYFVNILDGDTCRKNIEHIKNAKTYFNVENVFIGDTKEFSSWINKIVKCAN